jgi:hypothetical protein
MSRLHRRYIAPVLVAAGAATSIAVGPIAGADPVWPVAGAQSAADTIRDLEDQGYTVAINWTRGHSNVPLSQCTVSAIHNPDRSGGQPSEFTTVYVDVSCPSDDDDWGGVGFGIGIGF